MGKNLLMGALLFGLNAYCLNSSNLYLEEIDSNTVLKNCIENFSLDTMSIDEINSRSMSLLKNDTKSLKNNNFKEKPFINQSQVYSESNDDLSYVNKSLTYDLSCTLPTIISFNNSTSNTSTLYTNQTNQTYTLEYGPHGFTQGQGIIINNVTTGYIIQNLAQGTTYDVYLRVICENQTESIWSNAIQLETSCSTPPPTGSTGQTLLSTQTYADLDVNGQNIKVYNNPQHNNPIGLNNTVQSGTYYVTQSINCESSTHLVVNVVAVNSSIEQIPSTTYNVCGSTLLSQVNIATTPNTVVKWYQSANSTQQLPLNTVVNSNVTYYATQTVQNIQSERFPVQFIINQPPTAVTTTHYTTCTSTKFGDITLPENTNGSLVWYVNYYTANPIDPNTSVSTGMYYVCKKVNNCLSNRAMIQISTLEQIPVPSANIIDICGNGTIADLNPLGMTGATYKWYNSSTSTTPLAPTTPLTTSTYYVQQIYNGCSSARKSVSVRINSLVAPILSNVQVCQNTKYMDIVLPNSETIEYRFYNSPTAQNQIPLSSSVTNGTHYVARVINGCESNRTPINISFIATPPTPTGDYIHVFNDNTATIANIIMDQTGILWYSSYINAITHMNPLPSTTPLINGQNYYGVLQSGNCYSTPREITIQILLSNHSLEKEYLKVYPNPVANEVFVEYKESIDYIQIYDANGKLIKDLQPKISSTKIDLSTVPSGFYFMKILVNNRYEIMKLSKK